MQSFTKFLTVTLTAAAVFIRLSAPAATVTNLFGFSGKEVYPIDQGVSQLHVADIDGDGLNDIILVNNLRAKISLLYNLTGKTNAPAPTRKLELNELPPDARGILWADVDDDGRADLLVAEPESGQLSVYLQQADGTLAAPKKFPSLAGVSQIDVADWNNDGHAEIFLLSRDENAIGTTQFDKSGRLPLS